MDHFILACRQGNSHMKAINKAENDFIEQQYRKGLFLSIKISQMKFVFIIKFICVLKYSHIQRCKLNQTIKETNLTQEQIN